MDETGLRPRTLVILHAVDRYAVAHGWPDHPRAQAKATLVAVFDHQPDDTGVSLQDLIAAGGPSHLLPRVLAELGDELGDDLVARTDALSILIDQRTAGLPRGIRQDVAAWMTVLHDGGVRSRPRTWKTVTEYSRTVRPTLRAWAVRHQHLREITPDHVRAALSAVPAGSARWNLFVALRSLFRFLRHDGRVFTNPTAHVHLGARPVPAQLPLTDQDYRRVSAHATTELHRVVLILAALHAAGPHAIRALQLTDLNLSQRTLTVSGVRRQLDDLSLHTLTEWLDHRRTAWPLTANPHLIVSPVSALTGQPISTATLAGLFRGTGVSLDRLRMDRHLEEALAYGPDPLHLTALFGISEATGIRYAKPDRAAGPAERSRAQIPWSRIGRDQP